MSRILLALGTAVVVAALVGAFFIVYHYGRDRERQLQLDAHARAQHEVDTLIEQIRQETLKKVRAIQVPSYRVQKRVPTGADANRLLAEPGPK